MVGGCLKPSRFSQSIVSVIHILQRFAFVRRGRSWVPSPLAGEGQGEGKSSGNASTHPNEKCCRGYPRRSERSPDLLSASRREACAPSCRLDSTFHHESAASGWNHPPSSTDRLNPAREYPTRSSPIRRTKAACSKRVVSGPNQPG